jgi:hemerythrin superfamily protein
MAENLGSDITATELLRQQHQTVQQMLSQFVPSKGSDRGELFDCLRATLAVHETAEEMIVYPVLRGISDVGKKIAEARVEEESEAKDVLAQLEKLGVDGSGFDEQFEAFRKSVLKHAGAEESEVFPLLESNVDNEKLRKMASSIQMAEKLAPTHPHPHGPDSAVGNMLVGPFVGMVDKVRDALSGSKAPAT